MNKKQILFELRNYVHFLTADEVSEILNDDVKSIKFDDDEFMIKFACNKQIIIYSTGYREWLINGKLHRENGKPAVIRSDGSMVWYVNGKKIK